MPAKIAITGPESTGKTQLCIELAKHYNGICVSEFARDYLSAIQRPYNCYDLDIIATQQLHLIKESSKLKNNFLFADTELTVIKIWYEHAYKYCPEWILKYYEEQDYNLYLLMDIDLPWVYDKQREHPHLRTYFFNLYETELKKYNRPYKIISGTEETRLKNAIKEIDAKKM